jgi:ElaB/YqjD/DUF883 family membrane-anchored ribosome-binding protein
MGQDPDAIRQDIEQTRAEMTETVAAIGYKADVPSRAKEAVAGKVDAARSKVGEATTRAREAVAGVASRAGDTVGDTASRVGDATPSGDQVRQSARRAAGLAQENPLGLAIGAAAVGFLAGLAVPSTRAEDERLGPVADQVKDKVKETGQEALERGKEVAREAASSTAEAAREHGQDLAASAKQRSQEVRDQVR